MRLPIADVMITNRLVFLPSRTLRRHFTSFTSLQMSQPSSLEKYLALHEVSENVYQNSTKFHVPFGGRGVFGGTLAAQSVLASLLSTNTPDKKWKPASIHCFFLQAVSDNSPATYKVTTWKGGKNYQTKEVHVEQDGVLKFKAICSLQAYELQGSASHLEGQLSHQPRPPVIGKDILPPAEMDDQETVLRKWAHNRKGNPLLKRLSKEELDYMEKKAVESYNREPCEWRLPSDLFNLELSDPAEKEKLPSERSVRYWVRTKEPMMDPDVFNWVALAYVSDYFFLTINMRLNHRQMFSHKFSVSLDHTIYFHRPIDPSHWFSHTIRTLNSEENRSVMNGNLFSEDGVLAATTFQEGMSVIFPNLNAKL